MWSEYRKVLPQVFEDLLSVHMLWEGILRLLGCHVAALKVPQLQMLEGQMYESISLNPSVNDLISSIHFKGIQIYITQCPRN